jgi:TPP-dependent pyruvate/acetoin dehydrogenase alpha subunit
VKEPNYVERARSYGVEAARIEAGDVLEIHNAVQRWRGDPGTQPSGPLFLEIEADRWRDHVGPGEDTHLGYRSVEEVDALKARDQVARVRAMLDEATAKAIETRVKNDIEAAFAAAAASTYPGPEELVQHVFR